MLFMGADGVEGNKSLKEEAEADLAELRAVSIRPHLQIFVEVHGAGTGARHYTSHGQPWKVDPVSPSGPGDFVNGIALTRFLAWALKEAGHKEEDHSILILWGHAYRFAIGHTDTQAGIDALDFAELASVLSRFQEMMRQQLTATSSWASTPALPAAPVPSPPAAPVEPAPSAESSAAPLAAPQVPPPPPKAPPKLDMVAFDSCSLATIEMAYQLAPYARYMVASQVGVPLPGWPYARIFERLAVPIGDRVMGPAEFGSWVVRRYCEHYRALDRPVTMSHLKLSHASDLLRDTEALARALAVALDDDADELRLASSLFEMAQTALDEPFVDVIALCRHLTRYSSSAAVRAAARDLGDSLLSPIGFIEGQSASGICKPFIVEHGRNSCEAAGLHGISLYAPHVAPGHNFGDASHFYEKFVFARDTLWRELVRALALPASSCC